MKRDNLFKKDLARIKDTFPKLNYFENKELDYLLGDIDVCDTNENYFETFNIKIIIPKAYPHGVPILLEISNHIPREDNRHINKHGICCVDMDHELLFLAKRKLLLYDFIHDKVYPFLANQKYFDQTGNFAGDEYPHYFDGVVKFYEDRLNLLNDQTTIRFLEALISNTLLTRNEKCWCGSNKKYKNCHESALEFLKSVGKNKVLSDLKNFKNQ